MSNIELKRITEISTPNAEQLHVIQALVEDCLLVVAGPGTGKTQVSALRLVHLLNSRVHPAQILVLSFSRSAVYTLTRRISMLGQGDESIVEDLRHLAIRTFDSWTFRMLRQMGVPSAELLAVSHDDNIRRLAAVLDAGGGEKLSDRLSGIRHVIIDEFQDLAGVRADLVISLLSFLNKSRRVGFTVLGDPAQAIYGFASGSASQSPSDPWIILKTRMGSGLKEITLTQNFRSTPNLADMANRLRAILSSAQLDVGKKLAAMKLEIERLPVSAAELKLGPDWLDQMPEGSLAVLTRTNGEALRVWQMLQGTKQNAAGTTVRLRTTGATPFVPAWIAVLLSKYKPATITRTVFDKAYAAASQLDLDIRRDIALPPVDVAWLRLARASGAPDSASAIDLPDLRNRLDWPDSFPDDQVPGDAGVLITTIHQSKGMEFDNVALLEPQARAEENAGENHLEEAYVGFVAVTRAGRQLGRLPATVIHTPTKPRTFKGGRVRQYLWRKMVNLQMGLQGDIDPVSFVDATVHGGPVEVGAIQTLLCENAVNWRGRKVILQQVRSDSGRAKDVRYEIRLQMDNKEEGLLLGRTSAQVTYDLLDVIWEPGYSLPKNIYNLRIAEVISMTFPSELAVGVPEPWQSSRLWLGISLIGSGDFKTWKRNGNLYG